MTGTRTSPYVWCSGIARLLTDENQCAWAHWFRAHFTHIKVATQFDAGKWQIDHAALVRSTANRLREAGSVVSIERENWLRLESGGITLGGKPDIIAVNGRRVLIVDCKTGSQHPYHTAQVMIYIAMVACARPEFSGHVIDGLLQYKGHEVLIATNELDQEFRTRLREAIHLVGGESAPRRVPTPDECHFCDIRSEDCPDRLDITSAVSVVGHNLF